MDTELMYTGLRYSGNNTLVGIKWEWAEVNASLRQRWADEFGNHQR